MWPNLRIRGHLPAPIINGEEIATENDRIFDFPRLVTLTLDRIILHTVMHHSLTSMYTPNVIEFEETFCGRTDVRTDGWTDERTDIETHFIRSTRRSQHKYKHKITNTHIKHHTLRDTNVFKQFLLKVISSQFWGSISHTTQPVVMKVTDTKPASVSRDNRKVHRQHQNIYPTKSSNVVAFKLISIIQCWDNHQVPPLAMGLTVSHS